jgi:molybdopterin-guanine dinucleotide biosynthesis protein A
VTGYAAVILAGGAGRRLGGPAKPTLSVGGRMMLERVLDAVADAAPRIVVGPATLVVSLGVHRIQEQPPGGGPVAALAAGLRELTDSGGSVAVLAADLPFLTPAAIRALRRALEAGTDDGVVFVDGNGRRQTLCGVWRTAALSGRLAELPGWHGAAIRDLLAGLRIGEITDPVLPPPWYDCDSPDDLNRAERWT